MNPFCSEVKEIIHFDVLNVYWSLCGKDTVCRNYVFSLDQLSLVKII